jgi:peptidoglycan/LPS O-acetylase OafA/YrhL
MFVKPAPPTLWFITMLMLFYCIAPWFVYLLQCGKIIKFTTYFMLVIVVLSVYDYLTAMLDERIFIYFPAFMLGMFVGCRHTEKFSKKYRINIVLLMFTSFLISLLKSSNLPLDLILNVQLVLLCSYFLFGMTRDLVIRSVTTNRIIYLLSYSSYCMYLFHRIIYVSLKDIYFPDTHYYQVIYLFFVGLPCVLAASFFIQKSFDLLLNTLRRRNI